MKEYVTTDSHGCNEELIACLELAGFNYDEDRLYHLGDIVDRGIDSFGVLETLLKVKNLISIRGNHDSYFQHFIKTGRHFWEHGSHRTALSYIQSGGYSYDEVYLNQKLSGVSTNFEPKHIPQSHIDFYLHKQLDYFVDGKDRLFVHGGYDPMERIDEQSFSMLSWDRDLVERLASYWEDDKPVEKYMDVNDFKRVFIGHTPTMIFKKKRKEPLSPIWLPGNSPQVEPLYLGQLVDLDTGCCFGGRLTVIDITDDDAHIVYQVDGKHHKDM